MNVPATDPATRARRSVAGRFFGYPLVTILVGFVLIVFVLQAIVFANLIRLVVLLTGAPLPPPEQRGLPQDPATLSAWAGEPSAWRCRWSTIVLWAAVTVAVLALAARRGRWWSWAAARRAVAAGEGSTPVCIPPTGAPAVRG